MNTTALDQLGTTQQRLLRCLLVNPAGVAVDELVVALEITTTAVRQHLAALGREGFVAHGHARATRRRPQRLYVLTEAGREVFPRHYVQMADQLIEQSRALLGSDGLHALMTGMGRKFGAQLSLPAEPLRAVGALAKAMESLGYEAHARAVPGDAASDEGAEIVAYNCVFHHLAERYPEVCEYDLALMRAATGMAVDHAECMVRGGQVCRFRLHDAATPRGPSPSVEDRDTR